VSSSHVHLEPITANLAPHYRTDEPRWYAVQTRARHEKRVDCQFREKGLITFLPLLRQTHRWSDRRIRIEVPMFGCYAFVQMAQTAEERLKVLRTPGVLAFVGSERQGTPIPDEQIESLRTTISQEIPCNPYPFISNGKRVRVLGGSLDGVEGILVRQGADQSLVISVELLHRSVAIRVEGYDIELV
jgi:transcription antitermination factor NusG